MSSIHGILGRKAEMGASRSALFFGSWREFSMGKRAIIQHGLGYALYGGLQIDTLDLFATCRCCSIAGIGVNGRGSGLSGWDEGAEKIQLLFNNRLAGELSPLNDVLLK
jgi:hypothetical protein